MRFDPTGRFQPRLRGWRFVGARQGVAVPLIPLADGLRGIFSEALGLHLCHTHPWPTTDHHLPGAGKLRWHDPDARVLLETPDDVERRAAIAQRRAAEEAAARRLLEEKLAALEARRGGGDHP